MDLDLIPTSQRRPRTQRKDSTESRKQTEKSQKDTQGSSSGQSRSESRSSRRTKSSAPNFSPQVSALPSGDERNRSPGWNQSPEWNRGSKLRTSTSSMIKAERREKIDRERRKSLVEPPTYYVISNNFLNFYIQKKNCRKFLRQLFVFQKKIKMRGFNTKAKLQKGIKALKGSKRSFKGVKTVL